jgi:hypothetical protein
VPSFRNALSRPNRRFRCPLFLLSVNSCHYSTTNPPPASAAPRAVGIRLSEKSRKTYLDPVLQDPRTRQDDYADAEDDDVDAEGVTTRATAETLREEGEGGKSKSKSWVEENGEKVEDEGGAATRQEKRRKGKKKTKEVSMGVLKGKKER